VPAYCNFNGKLYEQCLFNLITNAVKFNKKGGFIKVYQSYDKTTQKLKTEIVDSGVGISEQKKLFLF